MSQQPFCIGDEVFVEGREGLWVIAEMVQEGDGIVTERPFWLRPDGSWTGWIRASLGELSPSE
ncbi:hypothetical protein [Cupriavidus sp. TMH.W2]|uniref:hypothetical protein n=1 Tax=Cupriavidus sp. TMH.W2 TaxID=3434465 RepID=UPI003D783218